MRVFVPVLILSVAALNAGGQTSPCADIRDPSERLACFDAQFPDESIPESASESEGDPQSAPVVEPTPETDVTAVPETVPPASETVDVTPEPETSWLGDEKVNLSSTIRAIRAGEKQKMVFLLDNEQIWMQSSPRSLPFEAGDRITIKNALLGGYYMHSENGTSTRVQRIQ